MVDQELLVIERELKYHEGIYSGFAQSHFARPGVRSFRKHIVERILAVTGIGKTSRVLSIGCGIGDTELLLAPHVAELVGVDLSSAGIRQARADAQRLGIPNAHFLEGTVDVVQERFDAVIAVFFLHHLSDAALAKLPGQVAAVLRPGGAFYSLDPSIRRLSGMVGRLLIPGMMKKYQTADERELDPESTLRFFGAPEWSAVRLGVYDFGSTPFSGLFPGWSFGYRVTRRIDDALLRIPLFRRYGSNFEVIAQAS